MNRTVGVLGGGQLGRMLATAGLRLGVRCVFVDPSPDACAKEAGELIVGDYDDPAALDALASRCDVVTYEFENVPLGALRRIEGRVAIHPAPQALAIAQDRVAEKTFFRELGVGGVGVPEFAAVSGEEEFFAAVGRMGAPLVLKTRRQGYDGKGQALIRAESDAAAAWSRLAPSIAAVGGGIVERLIPFRRELSIIAVRGGDGGGGAEGGGGSFASYPLCENVHEAGILRRTVAPAPDVSPELQRLAEAAARAAMERLGYVGVLAIEFFETGDAAMPLLVNEMACRVHNSGHWTIDGASTSQFENHLRAILGLPLGSTAATGSAVMLNLIGDVPPLERLAGMKGARVHLYGKPGAPGRKVGHVTFVESDAAAAVARGEDAMNSLFGRDSGAEATPPDGRR